MDRLDDVAHEPVAGAVQFLGEERVLGRARLLLLPGPDRGRHPGRGDLVRRGAVGFPDEFVVVVHHAFAAAAQASAERHHALLGSPLTAPADRRRAGPLDDEDVPVLVPDASAAHVEGLVAALLLKVHALDDELLSAELVLRDPACVLLVLGHAVLGAGGGVGRGQPSGPVALPLQATVGPVHRGLFLLDDPLAGVAPHLLASLTEKGAVGGAAGAVASPWSDRSRNGQHAGLGAHVREPIRFPALCVLTEAVCS